jgi:TatA/E family protein of Tat protein translocase
MNILGVGPAELLVVLIIALLVFGPTRLPQVAKDLGKAIGKWRQALDEIQSVTDAPLKEIKEIKEAVDPAAMERKLQESVQEIVTAKPPSPEPKEQGQEPAEETIQEQQEKPEAKD